MFLDVPVVADLLAIREKRQSTVDKDTQQNNSKCYFYNYRAGEKILKNRHDWRKLGEKRDRPYKITWVHTNGNVTVQLRDGLMDRLNLREIKPYHEPTVRPSTAATNQVVSNQSVAHCTRARR